MKICEGGVMRVPWTILRLVESCTFANILRTLFKNSDLNAESEEYEITTIHIGSLSCIFLGALSNTGCA